MEDFGFKLTHSAILQDVTPDRNRSRFREKVTQKVEKPWNFLPRDPPNSMTVRNSSLHGSFSIVAKELKLTPTEELYLLIKWLGPSSSEQAKRIRVANANNQERGLQLVWERLHDRFARPENVEPL